MCLITYNNAYIKPLLRFASSEGRSVAGVILLVPRVSARQYLGQRPFRKIASTIRFEVLLDLHQGPLSPGKKNLRCHFIGSCSEDRVRALTSAVKDFPCQPCFGNSGNQPYTTGGLARTRTSSETSPPLFYSLEHYQFGPVACSNKP